MAGPKVSVFGAGSHFFGKKVVSDIASHAAFAGGTLALVDTNPEVLGTMMRLARRLFETTGADVTLLGSTDRREVMADSDFMIFTFAQNNAHYRGLDTQIAAKYGMRMASGDTIGPGGIFRALREVPQALAIARDAEELAPRAWILNYVNPTAVLGMALRRYSPGVRSMAICDGLHEPYHTLKLCAMVGILPEDATSVPPEVSRRLDVAIAGVNHCTWLLRFTYDGQDKMPALLGKVAELAQEERSQATGSSKWRYNHAYALQLFEIYGAWPTITAHTKEYVPFFQGHGVGTIDPEPLSLFDAQGRAAEMAKVWRATQAQASGDADIAGLLGGSRTDMATEMMETMWNDLGKPFYINTANRGAVTNLPADAFIEVRCGLDMHGPRPQPVGDLPRGVLALTHQVLDTHELTAEAAVTGDRATLRRAMLTDPICNNVADADNCVAELLEAERDALPDYWF